MNIQATAVGRIVLAVAFAAAGCQQRGNPNAEIERAIQQHLSQRSGLAMDQMVMEIEQVRVNGDRAEAEVVFRTTTEPPARMAYHYELRKEANQWRVEGGRPSAADSTHPPPEGAAESPLPEGHPPVKDSPSPP